MQTKFSPQSEGRRIAPLAKLPVFWDLEGKSVLLAGGSEGAAWKAELLAACGAIVHVHCRSDDLSLTMQTLLENHAIRHLPREWQPEDLHGAALALGDFEGEDEASAFYGAACRAGVPVNVIDKPAYCQFQFGSIVNRSPVIVAISTDGAAPILAQAIRRKIETLLPLGLSAWAEFAGRLRETVNRRLSPGAARRRFWEAFVDRTFAAPQAPGDEDQAALLDRIDAICCAPATGSVTLVGAGPGDAELLTLKAMRALQAADVILFDDLVSAEVLELARREAKRLLVGKRGGRQSCKQEDINDMMVRFARAGKRVVRLKAGDPMIFGRAGEEIERLKREGIAVDIVPGITAAVAMASALGVSLTHRDHAQQVRFVTGHSRHGGLPDTIDWAALADAGQTTVFYMGGRMAGQIQKALSTAGLDDRTATVVVSSVSRPEERRWIGPLSELSAAVTAMGYDNPVLIGVGKAFSPALSQGDFAEEPVTAKAS